MENSLYGDDEFFDNDMDNCIVQNAMSVSKNNTFNGFLIKKIYKKN